MKFLETTKGGGAESTVWAHWLIEIKSLFSIALLRFEDLARGGAGRAGRVRRTDPDARPPRGAPVTLAYRRFALLAITVALTWPMLLVGSDDSPPSCEEHGQGGEW